MKIQHTILLPALAAAFAVAAYAQTSNDLPDAPAATAQIRPNGPTVVMDTSLGRITCQFYQKQAPKAVANFIGLAEGTQEWTDPTTHQKHRKPYFNGTIFHRVIPGFMIQGGDPTGTGMGDPGYAFKDEFDPSLNFDKLTTYFFCLSYEVLCPDLPVHGFKLFLALFDVCFSVLEQAVYELGELVGSGGDCFWGAEFGEHAAVESAEGALASAQGLGGDAKCCGGP